MFTSTLQCSCSKSSDEPNKAAVVSASRPCHYQKAEVTVTKP